MNNEKEFLEKFKKISNKGWIKSVNKGTGSIGLTFEKQLFKKMDSMYFPDFSGIELKCTTRFSRFPITLFSCAFEGPTFPEINRLLELYGYDHYVYKDKKVLKVDVNTINAKKSGNFKFKLFVDEIDNKLYLQVYDLNDNIIEQKSFIYLDTIINRIKLKLKSLVIVYGSKKRIDSEDYFRYYKFDKYALKDEKYIIDMINEGKIIVSLESRIGLSGVNKGKYKNKNLIFKLKKDYIEDLYNKELTFDNDLKINRSYK